MIRWLKPTKDTLTELYVKRGISNVVPWPFYVIREKGSFYVPRVGAAYIDQGTGRVREFRSEIDARIVAESVEAASAYWSECCDQHGKSLSPGSELFRGDPLESLIKAYRVAVFTPRYEKWTLDIQTNDEHIAVEHYKRLRINGRPAKIYDRESTLLRGFLGLGDPTFRSEVFHFANNVWDVDEAKRIVSALPREPWSVPVAQAAELLPYIRMNPQQAQTAKLHEPLIGAIWNGHLMIIDGWHRIMRARDIEPRDYLPCYPLNVEESKRCLLK